MITINFNSNLANYNKIEVEDYLNDLRLVGLLSKLFSNNDVPFLYYRATENLYCDNFKAENLSREDVSVDAKLNKKGIGIKTFVENTTLQKIAEFNKEQQQYEKLKPLEMIKQIANLRNERLESTKNNYNLNELIYHCVVRNKHGFYLFEEPMNPINIDKIALIPTNNKRLAFKDDNETYTFDSSKSTLYKKFTTDKYFVNIDVVPLDKPIEALKELSIFKDKTKVNFYETIILPLYSHDRKTKKPRITKNGLNSWCAVGRKNKKGEIKERHPYEVAIPFNTVLRDAYQDFFPPIGKHFEGELPNGKTITLSVCQQGGKAIMSNPNKDLGEWILHDLLGRSPSNNNPVDYKDLLAVGFDAVFFQKLPNGKYKLAFGEVGELEQFIHKNVMPDYE